MLKLTTPLRCIMGSAGSSVFGAWSKIGTKCCFCLSHASFSFFPHLGRPTLETEVFWGFFASQTITRFPSWQMLCYPGEFQTVSTPHNIVFLPFQSHCYSYQPAPGTKLVCKYCYMGCYSVRSHQSAVRLSKKWMENCSCGKMCHSAEYCSQASVIQEASKVQNDLLQRYHTVGAQCINMWVTGSMCSEDIAQGNENHQCYMKPLKPEEKHLVKCVFYCPETFFQQSLQACSF